MLVTGDLSSLRAVKNQHVASWSPCRWCGMRIPSEVRDQLAVRFGVLFIHLNERPQRFAYFPSAAIQVTVGSNPTPIAGERRLESADP